MNVLSIADIDHIDLPGCSARWQNLADVSGAQFSFINYLVTEEHEGKYDSEPVIERSDEPCIHGGTGWLLTRQGWHQYTSWYRGHSYIPCKLRPRGYPRKFSDSARLEGTVANLVTEHNGAIGHVQREAAYRFFFLHEAGALDACDHLLMSPGLMRFLKRKSHELFRRYSSRIVRAGARTNYFADRVLTAPHPSCSMNVSRPQLDVLRRHLVSDVTGAGRKYPSRIFLPRAPKAGRAIANYSEVCEVMDKWGFEIYPSLGDVEAPSDLFAHADLVVGTHGSDLIDCDFMRPNSVLLEVLPTDHLKPYHFNSCTLSGAVYHALLGRSAEHRTTIHGPSSSPFEIDLDTLELGLRVAFKSLEARTPC